jgi:hypothetical protein
MPTKIRRAVLQGSYAGYDSMSCPQQNCLILLIRDLNGDLQALFHDEAFRGLAKGVRCLLDKGDCHL